MSSNCSNNDQIKKDQDTCCPFNQCTQRSSQLEDTASIFVPTSQACSSEKNACDSVMEKQFQDTVEVFIPPRKQDTFKQFKVIGYQN